MMNHLSIILSLSFSDRSSLQFVTYHQSSSLETTIVGAWFVYCTIAISRSGEILKPYCWASVLVSIDGLNWQAIPLITWRNGGAGRKEVYPSWNRATRRCIAARAASQDGCRDSGYIEAAKHPSRKMYGLLIRVTTPAVWALNEHIVLKRAKKKKKKST